MKTTNRAQSNIHQARADLSAPKMQYSEWSDVEFDDLEASLEDTDESRLLEDFFSKNPIDALLED